MTNDERVEAVARALAKADGKDPDAPAWVEGYGAREKTFGVCWRDQYSDKARAAIAALASSPRSDNEKLREALEYIVRQDGRNADGLIDWQRCVDRIQEVARAALTAKQSSGGEGE